DRDGDADRRDDGARRAGQSCRKAGQAAAVAAEPRGDGGGEPRFPDRRKRERHHHRSGQRDAAPPRASGHSAAQRAGGVDRLRRPRLWGGRAPPCRADPAPRRRAPMTMRDARSPRRLTLALLALACGVAAASLCFGTVDLPLARLFAAASGRGDHVATVILFDLRLPRLLVGLAVGAMLGLAGAALQGYLRNPLVEPSVLGTSNAAALGAVAALYFGLANLHPAALPLLSIAGALLSLALLFALAGRSESPLTLILAGIAVGTLAGAGISLALNLSPNPFAAMEIMTWLMGSLENRSFGHLWAALPCIGAGMALLLWNGRALDALTLGEDGAQALGVDL